jgi:sugar lactone lactonase YvrE
VWRVSPGGAVSEAFRVQPMANAGGVGRDVRGLPPGSSQAIVANGLAFGSDGTLYVADTARGAIWQVRLDRRGNVLSRTGCDTTFAADTLCLDDVFVEHPYLEGADGIVIGGDGTIYAAANERNAIVGVSRDGDVAEVFRNPVVAGLRNSGPLEFPTSPVVVGRSLCVTNSDGGRRDNAPAAAGEGAKVSCSHL